MFKREEVYNPDAGVVFAVVREPGRFELVLAEKTGVVLFMRSCATLDEAERAMREYVYDSKTCIWKITKFEQDDSNKVVQQLVFDCNCKFLYSRGGKNNMNNRELNLLNPADRKRYMATMQQKYSNEPSYILTSVLADLEHIGPALEGSSAEVCADTVS